LELLYDLMVDVKLRPSALQTVSLIAIGDFSPECKIVSDLVGVLQFSSGGTAEVDSNVLNMRKGKKN